MKLLKVFKDNAVLIISFVFACISTLFVPISSEYINYIDWRVITLLFCLMAVVAGLQESGVFVVLAQKLLAGEKSFKLLCVILAVLPFFFSMLITNDVALITFIPFTILVFSIIKNQKYLIYIITLQTVSANLGSMLTPIGNPQNLFLYSHYSISIKDFIICILPFAMISLIGVLIAAYVVRGEVIKVDFDTAEKIKEPAKLLIFIGMLALCLLTVFHVVNYIVLLIIVLAVLIIVSRNVIKKVDYSLLMTFICFFVFSGNMAKIPAIQGLLTGLANWNGVVTATAISQVISNVPAAVLLSGFTQDWKALLIGTNIGGLGTIIASLASLISFRFYAKTENAKPGKYICVFTVINILGLILLLGVDAII